MSSELLTVCCWAGNEGKRSTFSSMSEAQGGGLSRDQFPPNTTPARRESQRRYGGNTITERSIYSWIMSV